MKRIKDENRYLCEFTLEFLRETEKAYQFTDGDREYWIPKSQLEDEDPGIEGNMWTIVIPEWLAIEKGMI